MKKHTLLNAILLFVASLSLIFSCKSDINGPDNVALNAKKQANTNLPIRPVIIAGKINYPGNTDGKGGNARFYEPSGRWGKKDGSLLVADYGNNVIRQIINDSIVSTIHYPDVSLGAPGKIKGPINVAVDGRGYTAIVCAKDIFYFKPIDENGKPNVMGHTYTSLHNCKALGVDRDGYDFWISFDNQIVTDYGGYPNPAAYGEGQSKFPTSDQIRALCQSPNEWAVYAATYSKFYKLSGYEEDDFKGTSSAVYSNLTFTNITNIAFSKDGNKIYIADNGDIRVLDKTPGYRVSVSTLLTGVSAYGLAISNDGLFLYYSSQNKHTISKYKI